MGYSKDLRGKFLAMSPTLKNQTSNKCPKALRKTRTSQTQNE
jgi:hypothetical protein